MKSYNEYLEESINDDMSELHKHVTTSEPTHSNILAMHDKVRAIARKHGIPSSKVYNKVVHNSEAHEKFRTAATA